MTDDLAFARASIDWAVSNLSVFQAKMQTWLDRNIGLRVQEIPDNPSESFLIVFEKEALPYSFSVEAGAYINSIRSSLDLLATALAIRHKVSHPDRVQFPIAKSEKDFLAQTYKGAEFIRSLPCVERRKLEALRPFKGGNGLLWELHHLDNTRKHRRLLKTETRPAWLTSFSGDRIRGPVSVSELTYSNGETVLGLVSKWAESQDFKVVAQITVGEAGCLNGFGAVHAIKQLADMAQEIISQFYKP